jgi:hypothetical protein
VMLLCIGLCSYWLRRIITVCKHFHRKDQTGLCEWCMIPAGGWVGGKVHTGMLKDGSQVVIKVQHFGMEKVMASDLRNIGWVRLVLFVSFSVTYGLGNGCWTRCEKLNSWDALCRV